MPRLSSEAVSASLWREPDQIPQPPDYLKGAARAIWLEVVSGYAPGRFGPGSLALVDTFAVTSARLREVIKQMNKLPLTDPASRRLSSEMVKLTALQLSCATKLRLCPSSQSRPEDGRLSERRPHLSPLIGGRARN